MHYKVKRISFGNNPRPIVLQTTNGPCPLLAICNCLLLRGDLDIVPDQQTISFEELSTMVKDYLANQLQKMLEKKQDESKMANFLQDYDDIIKLISRLEAGLDINVMFSSCDKFEYTPATALFDMFGTRLFHGWVYDPQDKELANALKELSYNQSLDLLVPNEQKASDDLKIASKASDTKSLVEKFLSTTSTQLTVCGLADMHQKIREGELCVFFRNNHFSTVYKYHQILFNLVTDEGLLAADARIVWQRLNYIDGDDAFLNHEFRPPGAYAPPSSAAVGTTVQGYRSPMSPEQRMMRQQAISDYALAAQEQQQELQYQNHPHHDQDRGRGNGRGRGRGRGGKQRSPRPDDDGDCVLL